jgi:pimeloyl-ACP methyl ester carboxylesterase
MGEKLAD